jgi:hypothetical protein
MNEDIIIEKRGEDADGSWEYRSVRMKQGSIPLKMKLMVAALVLVGAAAGIFLFLFFLTLFLYLFVPAIILLTLWNLVRRRR